jgi:hypothetical protein
MRSAFDIVAVVDNIIIIMSSNLLNTYLIYGMLEALADQESESEKVCIFIASKVTPQVDGSMVITTAPKRFSSPLPCQPVPHLHHKQ